MFMLFASIIKLTADLKDYFFPTRKLLFTGLLNSAKVRDIASDNAYRAVRLLCATCRSKKIIIPH